MWICLTTQTHTNGEKRFYETLKPHISTIFDVGCKNDSLFTDFPGVVHYFDPVAEYINDLAKQPTKNAKSVFNVFGLGSENAMLQYYPKFDSFWDRSKSLATPAGESTVLKVRTAKDYMDENNISYVDFVKIDTEGHELQVMQGFGDYLRNVRFIQYEHGGTYIDSHITLAQTIDHLRAHGFDRFAYLSPRGTVPVRDTREHYQHCNIVCENVRFRRAVQ